VSPDPLGPVVITAREIYDAVVRLTGAVEGVMKDHSEARNDLIDHEARLRALERSRWPLPSLAALLSLGALAVAVVPLLAK
jgi:hypothetical protein